MINITSIKDILAETTPIKVAKLDAKKTGQALRVLAEALQAQQVEMADLIKELTELQIKVQQKGG